MRSHGRAPRRRRRFLPGAAVIVVLALAGTVVAATTAPPPPLQLRVLSNRADLLSGGDALVEVVMPQQGHVPDGLTVLLDERDVTQRFQLRRNGKYLGLVTGLREGGNHLSVTAPGTAGAALTLTNHPIGGPIFSGRQVRPWQCATTEHGLGPPRDDQCNTAAVTQFFYRSKTTDDFLPYDPSDPPPDRDIARTTTDEGHTVPYVVRRERGVINRGIYDVAVLYRPGRPWKPWAPQRAWNRKLFWMFGGSCQPYHAQQPPDARPDPSSFPGVFHHEGLSRGFAVAASAMTVGGNNCNSVVAAETLMMVKEHIIETYGPVRFTFSLGGSGGSIQQLQIAEAYPGLLDGIITWATFADLLSTVTETFDCRLLTRYFATAASQPWDPTAMQAVMGHASTNTCTAWVTRFGFPAMFGDPTLGCTTPLRSYRDTDRRGIVRTHTEPAWAYDPDTNPDGVRCTVFDYLGEVLGRHPGGKARRPYDNVGVQYGLAALLQGRISAEQFVDLNARVGGLDLDYRFRASRSAAGRGVLRAAYRSGQVTSGRNLTRIPILDASFSPSYGQMHTAFHSRKLSERLVSANGSAANLVSVQAATERRLFNLMDRWLTRIEADDLPGSQVERVVRTKPAGAEPSGTFRGTNPRVAAGAPLRDDILKCRLQPLRRFDYGPVTFTTEQWRRLEAVFPHGVCDWTKPGVGQTTTQPWLTYADDKARVLRPAPRSQLLGE